MSFKSFARTLREGHGHTSLDKKIAKLLRAVSDGDGEDIVLQYPELISKEAQNQIRMISKKMGDEQAERFMQEICTVLERCEAVGAKAAFDQWRQGDKLTEFLAAFVIVESDADLKALLTRNISLLEVAEQRLGELFLKSSAYSRESSDELRKVLRDAKAFGVERAVLNRRALLDDRLGKGESFSAFLNARSNNEELKLLRNHPSLSAPATDRQLRKFLDMGKKAGSRDGAFEDMIARKLAAIDQFRRSSKE
jgi:hypothetical protein